MGRQNISYEVPNSFFFYPSGVLSLVPVLFINSCNFIDFILKESKHYRKHYLIHLEI